MGIKGLRTYFCTPSVLNVLANGNQMKDANP